MSRRRQLARRQMVLWGMAAHAGVLLMWMVVPRGIVAAAERFNGPEPVVWARALKFYP